MSISDRIPKQIEEVLVTQSPGLPQKRGTARGELRRIRRSRLTEADAQTAPRPRDRAPIPIPISAQIDSWIVIHPDNTATFYVGKTDPGQGTGTGFRQLMSDELDIAFDKTTCIMGSTDITVDQVGSGGSTAMERDSWPMRRVAAEARRVLLEMAIDPPGSAGRSTRRERRGDHGESRSFEARYLWRTDRGKEVQCHAERQQRQRGHRSGQNEDGAGAQIHGPVAASRRHSRQSGRFSEMGRRREAAGHGSRAQRETSVRLREADRHRRIVGEEPAGLHQGDEQRQLRRRCVRTRRAGHPRRPPAQDDLGEAGNRSVPGIGRSFQLHAHGNTCRSARSRAAVRGTWEIPMRHFRARQRRSKPSTRYPSRDTPRSPALMPRRTRRTVR